MSLCHLKIMIIPFIRETSELHQKFHLCKPSLGSVVGLCPDDIFGRLQNQFASNIALQLSKHGKLNPFWSNSNFVWNMPASYTEMWNARSSGLTP